MLFHHNSVTMPFLPRVTPFFVSSHHQNLNYRSLFIFSDTQTTKSNSEESLCVVIMNSHHHCPNCSIFRYEIEKKDKRIIQLQLELQRLRKELWDNEEYFLQSENADLNKKLNKAVKWLTSLTQLYNEQQNVIKKLQKETIETIGKVMISFIYNPSD